MIVILFVSCFVLLVSFAMWALTVTMLRTAFEAAQADHAKCVAHIAHYVGDLYAARILTAAAEDYDSVMGQHQLKVLANEWKHDGPGVPAMWLVDRAAKLLSDAQT